jgi:hypothetical protein
MQPLLALFISKKQLAIVLEFVKPMKLPQMQCEGTKRKCESVWMIFVFDRANILTGIAFTRQQQYSNTPDPFAKETQQKTLQPRQS